MLMGRWFSTRALVVFILVFTLLVVKQGKLYWLCSGQTRNNEIFDFELDLTLKVKVN